MSLAVFKDLCIDAVDPVVMGEFWGAVLGLEFHLEDNGDSHLTGPTKAHTVWVNKVPEAKSVKHRLHLDVYGKSASAIEALGGSVVDSESFAWTVLTDPEGGEFCLFERDILPPYRLYELILDCVDHEALSAWWATLLGAGRVVDERGFSYIEQIPNAPFEYFDFSPSTDPKLIKNRIHLDLEASAVAPLIAAGATRLRERDDEIGWDVMADPEGNEFCVFVPQ